MTAFYVGQRVRIKWSETWPFLAGREGQVIGINDGTGHINGPGTYYEVQPDGFDSSILPDAPTPLGFARFAPSAEKLEPILYDGNRVVEWSECLWRPERQGAPA